jgi:hypothetical protein
MKHWTIYPMRNLGHHTYDGRKSAASYVSGSLQIPEPPCFNHPMYWMSGTNNLKGPLTTKKQTRQHIVNCLRRRFILLDRTFEGPSLSPSLLSSRQIVEKGNEDYPRILI